MNKLLNTKSRFIRYTLFLYIAALILRLVYYFTMKAGFFLVFLALPVFLGYCLGSVFSLYFMLASLFALGQKGDDRGETVRLNIARLFIALSCAALFCWTFHTLFYVFAGNISFL